MDNNNDDTAAWASIEDVADAGARVDAQLRAVLRRVMAQDRSAEVAFDYVTGLAPGVRANCWSLAEATSHGGPHRMQALLRSYQWEWEELRADLPALAAAWIPDDPADLIGPGLAIDETAHLKKGDATACVSPQHAGVTGKVENCVTSVFSAYVTAHGQAWADFDLYLPTRWADDPDRRKAAGVPEDLTFATKPDLAIAQLERLLTAGLPIRWVAFDEVYGRSEPLRVACAKAGLAYVAVVPCDYRATLPSGRVIQVKEAVKNARFERRSCGTGTKGPRYADWALAATAVPGQYLLIRRLLSRPDQLTFYLCWAPEGRPATTTYFLMVAGRRWPVEETFKTAKDVLGWDTSQVRTFGGICRHTVLTALAQLRQTAVRNALTSTVTLPDSPDEQRPGPVGAGHVTDGHADLRVPLGDAPLPARGGLPCPPGIGAIRLSVAETTRLHHLAQQAEAGLISRARLALALRWSTWRRRHQARARWHHHSARLLAAAT